MSIVPDTGTFSLQEVYNAVSSHAGGTADNLSSCFSNALSRYFDSNYNNDTYNGSSRLGLKRFRNYGPPPVVLTIDRSIPVGENLPLIMVDRGGKAILTGRIPSVGIPTVGDPSVIEHGFVYATHSYPTVSDNKVIVSGGSAVGGDFVFSHTLTNLTEGQIYYARSYAINDRGVYYGTWTESVPFVDSSLGVKFCPNNYYSGREAEGGIIVNVSYDTSSLGDWNVPHGLVMHPYDVGAYTWGGDTRTHREGLSQSDIMQPGMAKINTEDIVNTYSAWNSAGRICWDLSSNGYDDWWLPSEGDLENMIQSFPGYFTTDQWYWSSSEDTSTPFNWDVAWAVGVFSGGPNFDTWNKLNNTFAVLPCRYMNGGYSGGSYL